MDQPSKLSLKAKIDQYSDEDVENELKYIWEQYNFGLFLLLELVTQVDEICNALIQIEDRTPYSKSVNSSMVEARRCVSKLIQSAKDHKAKTGAIQPNLASSDQGPLNLSEVRNVIVGGADFFSKRFVTTRQLLIEGKIFDDRYQEKNNYSLIAGLTSKLSKEHKKKILVISHLTRREIKNLCNSDIDYIESVLQGIDNEIENFLSSSQNHDWGKVD